MYKVEFESIRTKAPVKVDLCNHQAEGLQILKRKVEASRQHATQLAAAYHEFDQAEDERAYASSEIRQVNSSVAASRHVIAHHGIAHQQHGRNRVQEDQTCVQQCAQVCILC